MAKIEKLENSQVKIIVDVTPEQFEEALNASFKEEQAKVQIKGFRKGQVPRSIYEREYGVESLFQGAVMSIADKECVAAVMEEKLFVVGDPQLDVKFEDVKRGEAFSFAIIVPVYPEFTVENYKGLKGKKMSLDVTEEEINNNIDELRKQNALVVTKESAIENGDIAVFDFKGLKDGVAFEGGTAENYELEIGSGQFIPGFEEQMVGMKAGDEKTINVTFPEEYQATDLAGKEVQFELKLHEVKGKELPELDDVFVKDLYKENVNTVDELKASIKAEIEESKKNSEKDRLAEELIDQLVKSTTIVIPEAMKQAAISDELKNFDRTVQQQYGMKLEDFKKVIQLKEEEFMANITEKAINKLTETLILEQIMKQENIKATKDEIEDFFNKIAAANNAPLDFVKKQIKSQDVAFEVSVQKVIDLLIENANLE